MKLIIELQISTVLIKFMQLPDQHRASMQLDTNAINAIGLPLRLVHLLLECALTDVAQVEQNCVGPHCAYLYCSYLCLVVVQSVELLVWL